MPASPRCNDGTHPRLPPVHPHSLQDVKLRVFPFLVDFLKLILAHDGFYRALFTPAHLKSPVTIHSQCLI